MGGQAQSHKGAQVVEQQDRGAQASDAAKLHDGEADEPKGCATICTRNGEARMCVQRIHWFAHDMLYDLPFEESCPLARKEVIKECPQCDTCSLEDAGCPLKIGFYLKAQVEQLVRKDYSSAK